MTSLECEAFRLVLDVSNGTIDCAAKHIAAHAAQLSTLLVREDSHLHLVHSTSAVHAAQGVSTSEHVRYGIALVRIHHVLQVIHHHLLCYELRSDSRVCALPSYL